jgi:hypothetical protein
MALQRIASQEPLRASVVSVAGKQAGGSQSRLILCDDKKMYVLKMHPNPQGPNVLANEALGAMLLTGLGFPVPRWRPITIDTQTLHVFPELTMEANGTKLPPACGVHFGSEYVGGPQYRLFDIIPASYRIKNVEQLAGVRLFDLWANHHDHRQFVYRRKVKQDGDYEAVIVDNGHLFGGPDWSDETARSLRLWFHSALKPPMAAYLDIEGWVTVFEVHLPKLLDEARALVPPEWYRGDIYALCARLRRRLEGLRALANMRAAAEVGRSTRDEALRVYVD